MNAGAAQLQQRALGAGLLLVGVWGASFSIQKIAYAAMGPGGYLFGRSLLMSLFAFALLRWRGSPLRPRLDAAEWRTLLASTAVGPVLHVLIITYGIHWSTPFSSALIMACGPVCTLLVLRLLRGTRLQPRQLAGVAAAFAGVLIFMSDKLMHADLRAGGGDLLLLLSALLFSLYTVLVTPLVARHGGPEVMSWSTLLAAPFMLALNAVPAAAPDYGRLGPGVWSAFLWTVVVSAFMGWIIWAWVNAVRGIARTAPLLYLIPPVAGVVGWLSFGESYGGVKLLGAALALAGVAWTQFMPTRERVGPVDMDRTHV